MFGLNFVQTRNGSGSGTEIPCRMGSTPGLAGTEMMRGAGVGRAFPDCTTRADKRLLEREWMVLDTKRFIQHIHVVGVSHV